MIDMTRQESEAVLTEARVGRLSMVGSDGQPYVIPLRFLWLGDTVYMRLAHYGRKAEALERNANVCFETDVFTPDFSEYASVLIEGKVVDVTDLTEKEEALFRFHEKYARLCGTGVPPRPVTTTGVALRKLVMTTISGRRKEPDEEPGSGGGTKAAKVSRKVTKKTRQRA
jgi:nitroimidazol reductase NimA-like FMN-containing flavoprotein (pyridoxamine 5'-phosphate oxidase superfamily)